MKDTLRILVSWKCNLRCTYCCNENPRFRNAIAPTAFEDIRWGDYENFCITGGEPLLNMPLVEKVCKKIPAGKTKILYTNGLLLTRLKAMDVRDLGIQFINVGLHNPAQFDQVILAVDNATFGLGLGVRFHAQDIYETQLRQRYPWANFRFWTMDDCDRGNEDRIVLKDSLASLDGKTVQLSDKITA